MNKRYIELDLLRSLAVVMMAIYHAAYDLETMYGFDLGDVFTGWWKIMARVTAVLFLLLVGTSFAISSSRHSGGYRKYLKRGLSVLGCGMLVSAVTFIADPDTYVRFGILHLIGVSILLLPFFGRLKEWNLLPGSLMIALGFIVKGLRASTSLFLPLGIMPMSFESVDYFPLLPWFGVVLIGYVLGYAIYVRRKQPTFSIFNFPLSIFTWPGRHALLIYLLHQPILLGLFGFLGFIGILPTPS